MTFGRVIFLTRTVGFSGEHFIVQHGSRLLHSDRSNNHTRNQCYHPWFGIVFTREDIQRSLQEKSAPIAHQSVCELDGEERVKYFSRRFIYDSQLWTYI